MSEFKAGDVVLGGKGEGFFLDGPHRFIGIQSNGLFVVESRGTLKVFSYIKKAQEDIYVPFTLETFPKCGAWVRRTGEDQRAEFIVGGVTRSQVFVNAVGFTYQELLDNYEISIDNRHTWTIAGREEWVC